MESNSSDFQSISEMKDALRDLHLKSAGFPEFQKKLYDVEASLEKKKDKNKDSGKGKSDKKIDEGVKKVIITKIESIEDLKSQEPLKILRIVLDIAAIVAKDVGGPYHSIFLVLSLLFSVFGRENNPNQPSVVHQLTKVVHDEMIHLNKRLHDQKYNGLKLRMSEQILQLQRMKEGEKLDDPSLWNDYVQFLGELAIRFESPLPFKYEKKLTKDPDVKDFVTAIVTYSEAFSSFMAFLLVVAVEYTKVRMAQEDVYAVYRKMTCQIKEAEEKLSFLSEERYLTFLGKIEGGKLTKIVALSRRIRDKILVETVRHSLGLSPMPNLTTVESSAKKVSKQAVTLRSEKKCNWSLYQLFGKYVAIQFFNEADVPMKIVSGEVGESQGNQVQFEQIVEPRKSYRQETDFRISTGGYIVPYFNSSMVSSDLQNTRVIEFAVSHGFYEYKIGMQDKTNEEFSGGQDALDESSAHPVTLYFSENGKYYIAKAEYFKCRPIYTFRFIIQDFDPEAVGDGEH